MPMNSATKGTTEPPQFVSSGSGEFLQKAKHCFEASQLGFRG